MRFVIGKTPKEFQVLDEDDKDITSALSLSKVRIHVEGYDFAKVECEGYLDHSDVTVLPENVTVNLYPMDPRSYRHRCLESFACDWILWLERNGVPDGMPEFLERHARDALDMPADATEESVEKAIT